MGCNCKTINKVGNKFKLENAQYEKKGFWYYIKEVVKEIVLNRILNALFLALVCIIMMPIMLVVIVLSQIILGNARIVVPENIVNKIKKKAKSLQNEQELQNTY